MPYSLLNVSKLGFYVAMPVDLLLHCLFYSVKTHNIHYVYEYYFSFHQMMSVLRRKLSILLEEKLCLNGIHFISDHRALKLL